jgi:hypothetical protein
MASTGAVFYLRTYGVAGTTAARSTGAVMYLPIRAVTGVYQTGVSSTQSRPNDVAWLPSAQTPFGFVTINGQSYPMTPDPAWYRAFQHLFEVKLGGRSAPSLPDVITTVESTQAAAVQNGQQVGALTQQSQANAESLNVVRQVIQNNALVGAAQIPPVVLNPYEQIP